MATSKPAPLLDLSIDDAPRDVIRIDGRDYVLRRSDDMTIEANLALGRQLQAYSDLTRQQRTKGTLSKDDEAHLDTLLRDICRRVLVAPRSVLEKLTPVHRFRIANVFLMLLLQTLASAKAMAVSGQPPIPDRREAGTRSSRSSAGSTAATRSRGGRAIPRV